MNEDSSSKAKEKKKERREKSKLTKEVEIVQEKWGLPLLVGSKQSEGFQGRIDKNMEGGKFGSMAIKPLKPPLAKPWRKLERNAWTTEVSWIVIDTVYLNLNPIYVGQ